MAMYARDIEQDGYISNSTRLWAWRPDVFEAFKQIRVLTGQTMTLSEREFAVLIAATVARQSDAYCSLAWGTQLAEQAGEDEAVIVLSGAPVSGLSPREAALTTWARTVASDATATTEADVDLLRAVGFSERDIFEITAIVAFRIAFSALRSALGARPDQQLAAAAPSGVRGAVSYGRHVDDRPSASTQ